MGICNVRLKPCQHFCYKIKWNNNLKHYNILGTYKETEFIFDFVDGLKFLLLFKLVSDNNTLYIWITKNCYSNNTIPFN